MRGKIIGAIVATLVVGFWVSARTQTAPSLQGVWRATEVVVTGANAATNSNPQPNLLFVTKQHYSLINVIGTAPRKEYGTPKDPAKLTDAEKIARYEAWAPFRANAGTYQVSGNTITIRPTVAKDPAVMTAPVTTTTQFKIEGNTLTLIQKSGPGQPVGESTTKLTRVE